MVKKALGYFILLFGLWHFIVPILAWPNTDPSFRTILTLGSLALAILSIAVYFTKDKILAFILAFMYIGGALMHLAYLLGLVSLTNIPKINALIFCILDIAAAIAVLYYTKPRRSQIF